MADEPDWGALNIVSVSPAEVLRCCTSGSASAWEAPGKPAKRELAYQALKLMTYRARDAAYARGHDPRTVRLKDIENARDGWSASWFTVKR